MLELYNGKNVEAEDWDYVMALPVPVALRSASVYGHEIYIIKNHDLSVSVLHGYEQFSATEKSALIWM